MSSSTRVLLAFSHFLLRPCLLDCLATRHFCRHEVLCSLSGVFMDHRGSGQLPTMQWLKFNTKLHFLTSLYIPLAGSRGCSCIFHFWLPTVTSAYVAVSSQDGPLQSSQPGPHHEAEGRLRASELLCSFHITTDGPQWPSYSGDLLPIRNLPEEKKNR